MFSEKDIKYRTILYLNALEGRSLSIRNSELLITSTATGETVTKLAFQKLLAVFVIGKCTISSPVIDALAKHAVSFCLLKQNLRPVLWKSDQAEGNYLLRQKQYALSKEDLGIAKVLVKNKIENQIRLLQRKTDTENSIQILRNCQNRLPAAEDINDLLNQEARAAKTFFNNWFKSLRFPGRTPKMKKDPINVSLDLGYTILFNFIEAMSRLFGFDLYVGVYHRLFFKRKSLVCDLMEPFRSIIDKETLDAFSSRRFKKSDFEETDGVFSLRHDKAFEYHKSYATSILDHKMSIFCYVRDYYRAFMKGAEPQKYPEFLI